MSGPFPAWMSVDGTDVRVRVKAVPGASRDEVSGALGDRLKVRVSAPPEGGRANAAIAALLADACGIPPRSVELAHGASRPVKEFVLRGAVPAVVAGLAVRER